MLRDYEKELRKEAILKLYRAGYLAESPRYNGDYLLGEYQLERQANEDFEDEYLLLEELIRKDVRDEEMEIARRDLYDLERENERLEKELIRVREEKELRLVGDLESILKMISVEEPATDNAEEWAFNDGVNSAVERLKEHLEAYKNRPIDQP